MDCCQMKLKAESGHVSWEIFLLQIPSSCSYLLAFIKTKSTHPHPRNSLKPKDGFISPGWKKKRSLWSDGAVELI